MSVPAAESFTFDEIARLPAPADNVAIVTRRLEAGTRVRLPAGECTLAHTVLEGHRFAVRPIAPGEPLLSWGWPFGHAIARIAPGDYVANASMLEALAVRSVNAQLPKLPNFADRLVPFQFDEKSFVPAPPVERIAAPRTFEGFRRSARRGTGTRNMIVILGTSSRTAAFVRELASRLRASVGQLGNLEGIVAVAHTEGGGTREPNNALEVLRALAGFVVHPNVGAVLAVDHGIEPITNARLRAFLLERNYPLAEVRHAFFSVTQAHDDALAAAEAIVRPWIADVASDARTARPLSELRLALQCGGSDAFSGVSGNPLAGAVAHELIRHGGSACLAETDEAFGGEAYVLERVANLETARAFVATLAGFRERLAWHGVTAESNPSGGNKLRGLYNITLKSLGAVHKKDPRTRLDRVIAYGEPMGEPGFYFMNSPGNDLEGIAGQVAAGCNLFVFVTGNGSVTNFPFAPTLKITTTTRRHQLLANEMDVNAGRYLDGEPMEELVRETFDLVIATAGGRRTQGERAGHSQVSLWRDWRQTNTAHVAELEARTPPSGRPLAHVASAAAADAFPAWRIRDRVATELIALVLPTSMCSSQIAQIAANQLNARRAGGALPVRFVALPHTEGCGFGGRSMHELLRRTYRGYATHPNVVAALFLEHGCELVPNDVMRHHLLNHGVAPEQFGWVSVQLDGGMDKSLRLIADWFDRTLRGTSALSRATASLGDVRLAWQSAGSLDPASAAAAGAYAARVLGAGGSVLLPEGDPLLGMTEFLQPTIGRAPLHATLAYGEPLTTPGFHIVRTETEHWTENLTGLGACGAHAFVTFPGKQPQTGHPFLPVLRVGAPGTDPRFATDFDLVLPAAPTDAAPALERLFARFQHGELHPAARRQNDVDFQLTRGLLGVSA